MQQQPEVVYHCPPISLPDGKRLTQYMVLRAEHSYPCEEGVDDLDFFILKWNSEDIVLKLRETHRPRDGSTVETRECTVRYKLQDFWEICRVVRPRAPRSMS